MVKDDGFKLLRDFADKQTNKQMDKQTFVIVELFHDWKQKQNVKVDSMWSKYLVEKLFYFTRIAVLNNTTSLKS